MLSTYQLYRVYTQDPAKSAAHVAAEPAVKRETDYYQANIGKVKTVDDFVNNYRLFSYAMKANGLGDEVQNRGFMRKVLTSDLSDPKSFVNKLTDPRYKAFALTYSFSTDGKVASTALAQNASQQSDTLARFNAQTLVGKAQSADAAYYQANIGSITSVDGLIGNQRLYRIALEAYGIDPNTTPVSTIRKVLESDPTNATSFVNTSGQPSNAVQSAADLQATISAYGTAAGTNAALASQATTETAYYLNAIPAVTNVDAFLSDNRLVAYASNAYGLDYTSPSVLAFAKANGADTTKPLSAAMQSDILRAALTSDLSDPQSVANTLGGGFEAAAAAYHFGPTGLQSASGTADTVNRYASALGSAAAAAETAYFKATMPGVTTVAQFLADPRLVAYAETAYGLTFPAGTAPSVQAATLQSVLTGDPTDPNGAATKAGSAFVTFASAFTSARVATPQGADAAESTVDLYAQVAGQTAGASTETQYYLGTMPSIKTADALVADSRLSAYVATAYGLTFPANASDTQKQAELKTILTSDPTTAGATYGDAARRIASAFQFTAQGTVRTPAPAAPLPAGTGAQPTSAVQSTVDLYTERLGNDPAAQAAGLKETQYYEATIGSIGTVDALVADPRLLAYATKAYGLSFPANTPATQQAAEIKAILTSNIDDPKSVASQVGDPARRMAAAFTFNATYQGDAAVAQNGRPDYEALAAAFNFNATGDVTDPRLAQTARATQLMLSSYLKAAGSTSPAAQATAAYVSTAITKVKTVDGFLSDPRLVAVATTAYGVTRPPHLTDAQWTAQLRSALTSDVSDPKSAASTLGAAFRTMAAAFNFAKDGSVTRDPPQLAQSLKTADLLADPYVQQAMNDEAGQQNSGTALALYFAQKAPTITDAYQILGDTSLLTVVQKALNLPTSMSTLNIDTQARVINDALKIADLKDPKKVNTIVQHFAARYDLDNSPSGTTSPLLTLFGGSTGANANAMLSVLNPSSPTSTTGSSSVLQLFGGSSSS